MEQIFDGISQKKDKTTCKLYTFAFKSFWNAFAVKAFTRNYTVVKNLLAMQETQVQSLGRENSLEKEMATHSSILTWRIPWTEEPGGL